MLTLRVSNHSTFEVRHNLFNQNLNIFETKTLSSCILFNDEKTGRLENILGALRESVTYRSTLELDNQAARCRADIRTSRTPHLWCSSCKFFLRRCRDRQGRLGCTLSATRTLPLKIKSVLKIILYEELPQNITTKI